MHFYSTLPITQHLNFDQLVAAFRATYTKKIEVLKAKLKAARQQPNQTFAAFLWDVRTLVRKIYRGQSLIEAVPSCLLPEFFTGEGEFELSVTFVK